MKITDNTCFKQTLAFCTREKKSGQDSLAEACERRTSAGVVKPTTSEAETENLSQRGHSSPSFLSTFPTRLNRLLRINDKSKNFCVTNVANIHFIRKIRHRFLTEL